MTPKTPRTLGIDMVVFESYIYRKLSFPLLDVLKEDLPTSYMLTAKDIGLLARLNDCGSVLGKGETMRKIFKWFDSLGDLERKVLYENIHCDPFELFIDAGWIDSNLKILV